MNYKYDMASNLLEEESDLGLIQYKVILVEDHLEKIMDAMSYTLNQYTSGTEYIALDFSNVRPRGSKTSHAGIATGPVSFAKTLDDLITPITPLNKTKIRPLTIVKSTHIDFHETSSTVFNSIKILGRSEDWSKIYQLLPQELEEEKLKPNWQLTKEELLEENERRKKQASPFTRK